MTKFLMAINWGDAAVTLLAAFGGAWFAYRFNLKQQEKWDKQRADEGKKEQQLAQLSQLNYLQTYLHFYADELYCCYQKLQAKQELYERIKKNEYQLSDQDLADVSVVFADLSSRFESNWKALSFTNNNPLFNYTLAKLETAIQRFNRSHSFGIETFSKDLDKLRRDLDIYGGRNLDLAIKPFVKKQRYNNGEELFLVFHAAVTLDEMIGVFKEYAKNSGYNFVENNQKEAGLSILSYSKDVEKFIEKARIEVQKYSD